MESTKPQSYFIIPPFSSSNIPHPFLTIMVSLSLVLGAVAVSSRLDLSYDAAHSAGHRFGPSCNPTLMPYSVLRGYLPVTSSLYIASPTLMPDSVVCCYSPVTRSFYTTTV
jgi:hypothetical protein